MRNFSNYGESSRAAATKVSLGLKQNWEHRNRGLCQTTQRAGAGGSAWTKAVTSLSAGDNQRKGCAKEPTKDT